jgi:hypothetical protein
VIPSILHVISSLFGWTLAADLCVLAPLLVPRATRGVAAIGFLLSVAILAFVIWVLCVEIVGAEWGIAAVIVSTLLGGIPILLLAAFLLVIHAAWTDLLVLAVMLVSAIIAGIVGTNVDDSPAYLSRFAAWTGSTFARAVRRQPHMNANA